MRLTRNDRLIQSRSRLGTYALLGGMVVVIGGFVLSTRFSQYLYVSMLALVVGLVLYQVGGYNLRRFGRHQRPISSWSWMQTGWKSCASVHSFYSWTYGRCTIGKSMRARCSV